MLSKCAAALAAFISFTLLAFQPYPHAFPREGVTKLFENNRITVWKAVWPTGVKQPFHQHKYDMAAVYLRYGRVKITTPDGKVTFPAPYEVPWPYFQLKGRLHKEEATSGPEQLAIMIDLKDDPAPPRFEEPITLEGEKLVLDNNRVRMWDYTWPLNKALITNIHDKDSVEIFFTGGTFRTRLENGSEETTEVHFADARFIPRGQLDTEQAVAGPPRAIIVELKP